MSWTTIKPAERLSSSEGRTLFAAVYAFVILVIAGVFYACLKFGYKPAWGMAAIGIGAAGLIALWRWPILMFAGLLFVGEYKTVPAQGISLSDPTMLMFLLCCSAIGVNWLKSSLSGPSKSPQVQMSPGRTLGITLFVLFVAMLAISFLYTPAGEYGRTKLLRFLTFETLMFFGPILLLKHENTLRPLLWAMIVLTFPLLVKQLLRISHPSQQVLLGGVDVTEIGPGMDFGTAILIVMYTRLIRSRTVMVCVIVLLSVGLVTSTARTPVLALIITLVISSSVLGTLSRYLSLKRTLAILCLVAVVAWVAFSLVQNKPAMHYKIAAKESEIEALITGSSYEHGTIKMRWAFYNSAFGAIMQHPFTGLGLGGWSVFYSGYRIEGLPGPIYPHSLFLEVGTDQGLLGLALLLCLLASLFHSVRKAAKYSQFEFLLPVLTFQVINHTFTGTIEDRALWFWFGTVVAVSQIVHNREMPRQTAQSRRLGGRLDKLTIHGRLGWR